MIKWDVDHKAQTAQGETMDGRIVTVTKFGHSAQPDSGDPRRCVHCDREMVEIKAGSGRLGTMWHLAES